MHFLHKRFSSDLVLCHLLQRQVSHSTLYIPWFRNTLIDVSVNRTCLYDDSQHLAKTVMTRYDKHVNTTYFKCGLSWEFYAPESSCWLVPVYYWVGWCLRIGIVSNRKCSRVNNCSSHISTMENEHMWTLTLQSTVKYITMRRVWLFCASNFGSQISWRVGSLFGSAM